MEELLTKICVILGAPICMWFWYVISRAFQRELVKDTGWKWLKYPFAVADCAYAGLCGYSLAIELTRLGLFVPAY